MDFYVVVSLHCFCVSDRFRIAYGRKGDFVDGLDPPPRIFFPCVRWPLQRTNCLLARLSVACPFTSFTAELASKNKKPSLDLGPPYQTHKMAIWRRPKCALSTGAGMAPGHGIPFSGASSSLLPLLSLFRAAGAGSPRALKRISNANKRHRGDHQLISWRGMVPCVLGRNFPRKPPKTTRLVNDGTIGRPCHEPGRR